MVSGARIQAIFTKVLSFNMPTLAVINGHAYGAGIVLSLCHDFRIMKANKARICLSEINLGFNIS